MKKTLLVDSEKCSGCKECEIVCSYNKERLFNPTSSRIHVLSWMREGLRIPMVCPQCEEPYCQAVCPVMAIRKDPETGVVRIDEAKCVGCKACIVVCPFGDISWNMERMVPVKCDLCDGDPKCVAICTEEALQYVPLTTANRLKMRRAAAKLSKLLKILVL
jgi:Fe-S-cluster-containing hydrogenase component 2